MALPMCPHRLYGADRNEAVASRSISCPWPLPISSYSSRADTYRAALKRWSQCRSGDESDSIPVDAVYTVRTKTIPIERSRRPQWL